MPRFRPIVSVGGRRTSQWLGSNVGGDPFQDDVVLLLNFDGTSGTQDAVDEGPFSLPLIWVGNAILSDVQTYNENYGTALALDGTGDYIRINDMDDVWQPGNGPWTIEIRSRNNYPGGNPDYLFNIFVDGSLLCQRITTDNVTSASSADWIYQDQRSNAVSNRISVLNLTEYHQDWVEWTLSFDGTTITAYRNGVVFGTNSPANKTLDIDASSLLTLGTNTTFGDSFQGHIQAVRMTLADRYGGVGYTVDPAKWTL